MFKTIAELVTQAETQQKKIYEVMIEQEMAQTEQTYEATFEKMQHNFSVMKQGIAQGIQGVQSLSGITGFDAKRMYTYIQKGNVVTDMVFTRAICYAIAVNEVNASMGVICANPTAGSCGVLPGVMVAVQEKLGLADEIVINHLFTAGAIGFVIANNACISGAAGGCQAEVGVASAMAAAAVTELSGGSPRQAAHAMAIALKNMLGLVCDPVAGLVEVPCIKRNAAGASNALAAAEMALAGVESVIPWDEVIEAMQNIGTSMSEALRETAMGGLAATKTGVAYMQELLNKTKE